jgi:hypothetical protein
LNSFVTIILRAQKGETKAGTVMAGDHDKNQPSLTDLVQSQNPERLRTLSENMSRALVESQKLMTEVLGHPPEELANPKDHPLLIGSGNSMMRLGESLAHHPDRLVNANLELVQGYMTLWHDMITGQKASSKSDRRFSDPEWSANPVFDFMRQAYDLNTKWLMSLVDSVPHVDLTVSQRVFVTDLARRVLVTDKALTRGQRSRATELLRARSDGSDSGSLSAEG